MIAGVIVLAAGAGVAAAVGTTLLNRTFTQPTELKEAFDLPVLGAVSEIPSTAVAAANRRDRAQLAAACAALIALGWTYAYIEALRLPSAPSVERAAEAIVDGGRPL